MAEQKNLHQILQLPEIVDELTAIYEDYMYMARQYERIFENSSVMSVASFQMERLGLTENPDFPWEIKEMNYYEQKQFQNFLNQKIHHDTGNAYVTLQHTNPADDNTPAISYVPSPYSLHTIDMPLPSAIERYIIVYPENSKIGNTEFYINDSYKAIYKRKSNKDTFITNALQNLNTQAEFRILITLMDSCRKYPEHIFNRFQGFVLNAYAAEAVAHLENNILETLGSFAEKTRSLCFKIYPEKKSKDVLEHAEKDGFICSAADFQDYINIRHLMRHQWDSMDELGFFDKKSTEKNNEKRNKYLQSYRRLCDRTLVQRMKAYIGVLYQMQHLMKQISPQYIIREPSESNSGFFARIKEYRKQNPTEDIFVEINASLTGQKHKTLSRNLRKIFPQVKINDDFTTDSERFDNLEQDYLRRALFLQTYHSLECRMMTYCMTRGLGANNKETWQYFKKHNLLTAQEAEQWHKYTHLRNTLSHYYYHPTLRRHLKNIESDYFKHLNALSSKLYNLGAEVKWLAYNLFEYTHTDGLQVVVDFNTKQTQITPLPENKSSLKIQGKIDLTDDKYRNRSKKQPVTEEYENGAFTLSDNKIIELKMPNGVRINFEKQRIIWASNVQLHTNAEHFNLLQSGRFKLLTDKNMRVTDFFEKNKKQPVHAGDTLLLDYRHRALINGNGRIQEFVYKNNDGQIIKTGFKQTPNGASLIFADGTNIVVHGSNITVLHNNQLLSYRNRREFIDSYSNSSVPSPQLLKFGNSR